MTTRRLLLRFVLGIRINQIMTHTAGNGKAGSASGMRDTILRAWSLPLKKFFDKLLIGENVFRMYVGAGNRLVMYGTEFDIASNTLTLNAQTMTDGLLFSGAQI